MPLRRHRDEELVRPDGSVRINVLDAVSILRASDLLTTVEELDAAEETLRALVLTVDPCVRCPGLGAEDAGFCREIQPQAYAPLPAASASFGLGLHIGLAVMKPIYLGGYLTDALAHIYMSLVSDL
jgi:hypothetical protein